MTPCYRHDFDSPSMAHMDWLLLDARLPRLTAYAYDSISHLHTLDGGYGAGQFRNAGVDNDVGMASLAPC